jgi:membrane-bound ClpP family serine protease
MFCQELAQESDANTEATAAIVTENLDYSAAIPVCGAHH